MFNDVLAVGVTRGGAGLDLVRGIVNHMYNGCNAGEPKRVLAPTRCTYEYEIASQKYTLGFIKWISNPNIDDCLASRLRRQGHRNRAHCL